jgi:hypothetical protein
MMFDFNVFIKNVYEGFMRNNDNQRYGQYMVNYLSANHPDIVIPEEIDPFYDNKKIPDLMNYLNSISD